MMNKGPCKIKVISIILAMVFLFINTAYAIDLPRETNLRKYLDFQNEPKIDVRYRDSFGIVSDAANDNGDVFERFRENPLLVLLDDKIFNFERQMMLKKYQQAGIVNAETIVNDIFYLLREHAENPIEARRLVYEKFGFFEEEYFADAYEACMLTRYNFSLNVMMEYINVNNVLPGAVIVDVGCGKEFSIKGTKRKRKF